MNKAQYRNQWRRTMRDDLVGPQLFYDNEIDNFIQEARVQAALRGRIVRISPRATVAGPGAIPIVAGQFEYPIDPSVFRILKVYVHGKLIAHSNKETFDALSIPVQARLGIPAFYYIDEDLTLVFDKMLGVIDPLIDNFIHLEGYKTPAPLVLDTDVDLEIPDQSHQLNLLHRAYSRGYLIQDSEVEHMVKSQTFEALFTKSFGMEKTVTEIRKQMISKKTATDSDSSLFPARYRRHRNY